MRKILNIFLILLCVIFNLSVESAFANLNFNLNQMRAENPDFTTFPDTNGIIWLKKSIFAKNKDNGFEKTHLYVILARRGIDDKWLSWNIPVPAQGKAEIFQAEVYSQRTGHRIKVIQPVLIEDKNIINVEFFSNSELEDKLNLSSVNDENFIIVIMWREVKNADSGETKPDLNAFEDVFYFQEDLPVWEAIAEIRFSFAPRPEFQTFPKRIAPEIKNETFGSIYSWRQVNLSPYNKYAALTQPERLGLIFGMRHGESGLAALMREYNNIKVPDAPANLKLNDADAVLNWLYRRPEIYLAGNVQREIPKSAPWTKKEKLTLAYHWLKNIKNGVRAKSLSWLMPLEIMADTPVCSGILSDAVLELSAKKSPNATGFFYDMNSEPLDNATQLILRGKRILSAADNGSLLKRKIPDAKSASNIIDTDMDLKLDANGVLSGNVKVLIKGAWVDFLNLNLDNYKKEPECRKLVSRLFPALQAQNFSKIELKQDKNDKNNKNNTFELSFKLDKKQGVLGTDGERILAMPPEFLPEFFNIKAEILPFDILFPFVLQQSINITAPKNTEKILASGKVAKYPEKINYSEDSRARRNKYTSNARFEVNSYKINNENVGSFRRSLGLWATFSQRQIPVQIAVKKDKK